MKDYKKEYYEQSGFWDEGYLQNPGEKERIEEIIKVIPPDTHSVLDVGCGNGVFVGALTSTFPDRFDRVVGLDFSKEALKYVKTEKVYGTISALPFEDESFDLVTSSEVLEHLPQRDFTKGILQLQRVSKKYIIVTVPNDQDLDRSLVMCPKCHCWFNPNFHMRSFNRDSLSDLFNDFTPLKVKEIGLLRKYYFYIPLLAKFYHVWKSPMPSETAICPQCGYQHREKTDNPMRNNGNAHFVSKILLSFKPLIKLSSPTKKRKKWLLALYEKSNR